jgi:tRNA(fMet)-specific endonuclease VapC
MVNLRFLLDSNVLSEPMRPVPDRAVMERLHKHQRELAISSVVWHELLYGVHRLHASRKRENIERYLNDVVAIVGPILSYDDAAAACHAAERARLTRLGRTPPFVDGQIAAIAVVHDLVLVTRNVADFDCFEGIHLENWHSS